MVRVKSVTNCSSYWLTLTPAISVRHFRVTLRNMGTFKNWKQLKQMFSLRLFWLNSNSSNYLICLTSPLLTNVGGFDLQTIHSGSIKSPTIQVNLFHDIMSISVHTLYTNVLISLVSKMYPRGIQLRKRRRVSRVAWTRGAFWEFS